MICNVDGTLATYKGGFNPDKSEYTFFDNDGNKYSFVWPDIALKDFAKGNFNEAVTVAITVEANIVENNLPVISAPQATVENNTTKEAIDVETARANGLTFEEFMAAQTGLTVEEYAAKQAQAERENKISFAKNAIEFNEKWLGQKSEQLYKLVAYASTLPADCLDWAETEAAEIGAEIIDAINKIAEYKAELIELEPATATEDDGSNDDADGNNEVFKLLPALDSLNDVDDNVAEVVAETVEELEAKAEKISKAYHKAQKNHQQIVWRSQSTCNSLARLAC